MCAVAARGQSVTVQPVADIVCSDRVVDLTRCEALGTEVDFRIAAGDSLTSVWTTDTRYDFAAAGDTVLLAGEESRVFHIRFTEPSPALLPVGAEALTASFSGVGRVYQSSYLDSRGMATAYPPERVTLVTLSADTLHGARLDRSVRVMDWALTLDSTITLTDLPADLRYNTRIERTMVTAPGEAFPRIFKKKSVTTCDGVEVASDSVAWMLTSPPCTAPQPKARRYPQPGPDTPLPIPPGGDNCPVTVTVDGDNVTVIPSPGADASAAPLRLTVSDVIGRGYIDTALGGGQSTVSLSALPHGEYIICVTAGGDPVSATKYVKK